jgi:hypothetical protein
VTAVSPDPSGITDEMVDAGMRAMVELGCDGCDPDCPCRELDEKDEVDFRRAVRAALEGALAGRAVVDLPEPDGTSYEGDPIWSAHVDYEETIFACVVNGEPVVESNFSGEPLAAVTAEMLGLRLLAAAKIARERAAAAAASGVAGGDTQ